MKKLLAILLAGMLTLGAFAVAAYAEPAEEIELQNATTLATLFVYDEVSMNMGLFKQNASYFADIAAANPEMNLTFNSNSNTLFTIHPTTGVMSFKSGFSSLLRGSHSVTITHAGELHNQRVIKINAYYEWYDYLLVVFAFGLFWLPGVNFG